LEPPGVAPITVPGAPYKFSATPWAIRRPAPGLGEHTAEVLGEVGISNDELADLRAEHVI
jgi:crotonobetainyl-CoA:carnitine CoA-transferase CaiB-like acyl-CoA transferase